MDLEQIAELIVRGSTEGMDKVKSDLDAVARSQDNLNRKSQEGATVTETVQKRQVSVAQAYDRVRLRIDDTFRSTTAFAKAQKTLDDAVAQGVMPRSQYLADLELLAARYSKSDQTQELFQRGQKALAADLAAGKIGSEQYQAALGSLSQRLGQTRAATAGLSFEAKNLSFQLVDVGQGLLSGQPAFMIFAQQAGQIGQLIGTSEKGLGGLFGELGSAITGFLTPMRLLGGGILGTGAAVGMAAMDWRDGEKDISRALLGIGKASGATADDMIHFSAKAALATNESFASARGVMTELVSSSGVARDHLAALGTDTLQFAKAMNIGSDEAAKFMAAALIDPVKGAEQINSKIQFLDNSTRHYIKTMADAGDLEGARALVIDKMTPAIVKAGEATDGWGLSWGRFKANISDISSSFGSIFGSGTDLEQRDALVAKRDLLTSNPSTAGSPIVLAGVERLNSEIDKLNEKIKQANQNPIDLQFDRQAQTADAFIRALNPAIGKIEELKGAVTALEKVRDNPAAFSRMKLGDNYDAALTAAKLRTREVQEQADATDRMNAKTLEIAGNYKGYSTETALTLDRMKDQLSVATSITAQDRLRAEAQATYNELLRQGRAPQDAAVIAQQQYANGQAAIDTGMSRMISGLQDQLAVAQAMTGQQRLQAQERATYNQLIMQGASWEDAAYAASLQRAAAEAQIHVAMNEQLISLQQQSRMQRALINGSSASTAAAIAYENAIRAGATETDAAAIKAETLHLNMIKAADAARKMSDAMHYAEGGPQEFGNQWGNQTVGLPGTSGSDGQRAMWDAAYGAGNYNTFINGGFGISGGRFDVMARPTDAGLQYQYSQTLNNAAMSRMDAETRARFKAGSYKLSSTDAQAIADAFLARGDLSKSANAQKAAADFVGKADSSSSSGSNNSLINPLYTSGSSNIIAFRAATGMDYTVPGTGPTDSVRVSGLVSPGERLIAIPPGGTPPADMRGGGSTSRPAINQRIVIQTASMRGAADTMPQIAARMARAASAAARHR